MQKMFDTSHHTTAAASTSTIVKMTQATAMEEWEYSAGFSGQIEVRGLARVKVGFSYLNAAKRKNTCKSSSKATAINRQVKSLLLVPARASQIEVRAEIRTWCIIPLYVESTAKNKQVAEGLLGMDWYDQ